LTQAIGKVANKNWNKPFGEERSQWRISKTTLKLMKEQKKVLSSYLGELSSVSANNDSLEVGRVLDHPQVAVRPRNHHCGSQN